MLISSLNREMTEKRCFVEIGDRIEKLLPVSECNALSEKRSICVSNLLPKKRIFRPSPERSSPTTTTAALSHKYDHSASTTTTAKTAKPISAKEERNFDVSIIGEIRINKRGEESFQSVAKTTRPSSVATTTTTTSAAATATIVKLNESSSNRNSDNQKSLFQDVDREDHHNNSSNSSSCSTIKEQLSPYDFTATTTASPPESSFTPPPLTIVTFKREGDVQRDADVNRNHHPIAKMKQRVASRETLTNGNDSSSEKSSVSKSEIIDKKDVDKKDVDKKSTVATKVATPVEKDERRVAPIIIRAPKLTTCEDDFSVEKRDIIRLPVKFTKVRPSTPSPSSKSSQNNGGTSDQHDSETAAEKQRSKPLSKQQQQQQQQQSVEKLKSVASPSKSSVENNVDTNAKTSSKKRKREFYYQTVKGLYINDFTQT